MIEKLKHISALFGGKFYILEFFILGICLFLVCSLINNTKKRFVVSLLCSLFLLLQLSSLYFSQTFISYRYYIHFNLRGITSMLGLYTFQIILFFILFVIVFLLLLNSKKIAFNRTLFYKKNLPLTRNNVLIRVFIIILLMGLSFSRGNLIEDSKSLFTIFNTKSENFNLVLKRNKINDYTTPDKLIAKKGKNIIVISLESFERSYLTEKKFESLTPNLRKLKQDWNYYDLEQNYGSDWTSGSLYTYLTGFPSFFGVYGNSIFQTAYHSEISSISNVLKKADYTTIYLNGNTDYSGVKEMLHVFDFDRVIDNKNSKEKSFESSYGLRDKDLFEIAKKVVKEESLKKSNFAMFISTTDTHIPDGIYDARMEKFVKKRESQFDFMLSSVDYMLNDFLQYLEKNNILENTSVYIFPDHLKMGDPSIFENPEKRGLYLLSNADKKELKIDTTKTLYQIDLPKLILSGAKIEHNMKFFTDYIKGEKNTFIKQNINEITSINTSGFLRYGTKLVDLTFNPKVYNKIKKDTFRFIAHAGGKINNELYTNSKEALDLSYKKGFRLFELDIIKTEDGKYVAAHDWEHWKEITGYSGKTPVTNKEFLKHKIFNQFTPLDMSGINKWFLEHKDAILITDKINEARLFTNSFIDKNRLMMELFTMEAVNEGIESKILSSMPSTNLIENLSISDLYKLKKKGVKNISISRRFIYINPELLEECLKIGIKPYAFHLNYDPGIDEVYVIKYEMNYFYGIYADDWEFN